MANPEKSGNWLTKLVKSPQSKPSDDSHSDAKARRREQVRRAQRTHRDRKASYVKALELEVAKLRAKDLSQEEELRNFKHIVRQLRDLLGQHNIEIPANLANIRLQSPQATIEILDNPGKGQSLRARMPSGSGQTTLHSPEFYGTSGVSPSDSHAVSPKAQGPHPYGLDHTQVGVDFVLTLEEPCLPHHQGASTAGPSSGHSMMLLAPIMARSPPISAKMFGKSSLPNGAKWNVPAIELEKLLAFSERLSLDEEITPVQAWQRIRLHDKFNLLTPTALETLQAALTLEVQCHGFGAVIDEIYFDQLLAQTFAGLENTSTA